MTPANLDISLEAILEQYSRSFSNKVFSEESPEEDDLMLVFGLTQAAKVGNKQYWGRELGMCWQRLINELCRQTRDDFSRGIRKGADELCDLVIGSDAVDTKYRIGSGDAGTLKKFKQYGTKLQQMGYRPVLLILRIDNLPAAITACTTGGWTVLTGNDSYQYIRSITGFDLHPWLRMRKGHYSLHL
jgi:hypothetical protein